MKYLIRQFDPRIVKSLKDKFNDGEDYGITQIILEYLPDYFNRKCWRHIHKTISSPRIITVYWSRDPDLIAMGASTFVVKREARQFVNLLFEIMYEVEESCYERIKYRYCCKLLNWKKHVRFIVIDHRFVIIEDELILLSMDRALNFYL